MTSSVSRTSSTEAVQGSKEIEKKNEEKKELLPFFQMSSYIPKPLDANRVHPITTNAQSLYLARYVSKFGIGAINKNPKVNPEFLSTQYNVKTGKPTDQKHSGRCWIFGSLNMMRVKVVEEYGESFEYSQNFIAFWDKYERANFFLEKMISSAQNDVFDHRMVNLLKHVYLDGGEWELFKNVVQKYGVVPKSAMPETEFSGNSGGYMRLLEGRLREIGGLLHLRVRAGATKSELQEIKAKALEEVYNTLACYLGTPPSKFLWKEKDGKVTHMTPLDFYKQSKCELDDYVHVTCLPYHENNQKLRVQDVGNMVEGEPLQALNLSIDEVKSAIRRSIKDGSSVGIAAETCHLDRDTKLFSMDSDVIPKVFGWNEELKLDKGERLKYRATSVAHMMTIIGCDDPDVSKYAGEHANELPEAMGPLWKIENSWKDASTLYMTDPWLDEYLYGIVIEKKYLSEQATKILDNDEAPVKELDGWDPFAWI